MEEKRNENWKLRTLIAGAIVGALTGLSAAYLMTRRAEQHGEQLSISGGQGLRLGMLLLGLIRQVMQLGED
jgi:ABC-type Mn2+/Zn2+ transport system permease subunit